MNRWKILAVLLAAVALASCYWAGNWGQGALTIDVSQIKPKQAGDVVRVYLFADGKLFSTGDGVPFTAEVPLASYPEQTKISIQGLPVGPRYQVLAGIGLLSGGTFEPYSYYLKSDSPFLVSPGTDTVVPVRMYYVNSFNGIYFSSELTGKDLKGVAGTGGSGAYTAEATKVYYLYFDTYNYLLSLSGSYDLALDSEAEGVSSFRVNGLSYDRGSIALEAFASTTNGVLPFYGSDGWGFQPGFSSALSGDKNILETASLTDGLYDYLFFRRASGLGGYCTFNYSWVNQDVPGVLDLAVSAKNAFFAATGGAFALKPAFLQDPTPTLAEHRVPFSAPASIVSLEFSTLSGYLYMGTTNGAYEAYVDEATDITFGSVSPIPGTEGQKITHVAVSPYNSSYQAFMSDYWLYIRTYGSLYEIPFFAVLPGKPTGLAWDSYDSVLYISGTEGLSAVWVGSGVC